MILIKWPTMKKFTDVLSIFNGFFFKPFALLLFFIVLALILKPSSLFYEWDIYLYYFKSIITDGDFNIINQVPEPMRWLVTRTFFHPDRHPESQTAVMLPIYLLEVISGLVTSTSPNNSFTFQLTTIAMNALALWLGTYFIKCTAQELALHTRSIDFLLFYTGTPILYFSLMQTTVLEVVAFPLLSYLVLICIRLKKQVPLKSPVTAGIVAAFLVITKATFWPICFFVFALAAGGSYKKKKYLTFVFFILSFLPVFLADVANRTIKFGDFTNPLPPMSSFYDYSYENIINNLTGGFFAKGGLFFAVPVYLLALIGLFLLLKNLYEKKILNRIDIAALLAWCSLVFLNHIFFIGYIVEDHLPGRIHLAIAPMLILGLIYLRNIIGELGKNKPWSYLVAICSLWHIVITFSYIVVESTSSYIYSTNTFPSKKLFASGVAYYKKTLQQNLLDISNNLIQITMFVFLIWLLIKLLDRLKNPNKVLRIFTTLCAMVFIAMTVFNFKRHRSNIEDLKKQNFYENKAIGNGTEIFAIDYMLDFVKTIQSRNNPKVNKKLKLMVQDYYLKVKEQVIKSTPELEAAISTNALDFSFMIKEDQKWNPEQVSNPEGQH